MEIYISQNIKRLRNERNMTQENLADIIGVSAQAVSKWERGDTCPDITLLPVIANTFSISIDELLGNDKIIIEEKIKTIITECKKLTGDKALEAAKRAYSDFPYDYRIVMLYVNALNLFGDHDTHDEITRLCKLVLKNCEDTELCRDASGLICGLKSAEDRLMFLRKYIEYNQDWNWFKVYPMDSDEGKILIQHEIVDMWWHLNTYIDTYGDLSCRNSSLNVAHETKIELLHKCKDIFYAFFDKGDLGEYTFYVWQYNAFLAREYAYLHMSDEALKYFEMAACGMIDYCNLPESYEYKNILLNHLPFLKYILGNVYSILSQYLEEIDREPIYDEIRNNSRFITAYNKLQTATKSCIK